MSPFLQSTRGRFGMRLGSPLAVVVVAAVVVVGVVVASFTSAITPLPGRLGGFVHRQRRQRVRVRLIGAALRLGRRFGRDGPVPGHYVVRL